MIIYFWVLNTVKILHFTRLPPLHVLSFLSMSKIGFQKKKNGWGGRWMFFWMSGIALALQEP